MRFWRSPATSVLLAVMLTSASSLSAGMTTCLTRKVLAEEVALRSVMGPLPRSSRFAFTFTTISAPGAMSRTFTGDQLPSSVQSGDRATASTNSLVGMMCV